MNRLLLIAAAATGDNAFNPPFSPGVLPTTAPFAKTIRQTNGINVRPDTRLQYAALDPMSAADSTKTGCPFLIQKYEFRTFDVPVLFGSGKLDPNSY
jgi:hypothetical protein